MPTETTDCSDGSRRHFNNSTSSNIACKDVYCLYTKVAEGNATELRHLLLLRLGFVVVRLIFLQWKIYTTSCLSLSLSQDGIAKRAKQMFPFLNGPKSRGKRKRRRPAQKNPSKFIFVLHSLCRL